MNFTRILPIWSKVIDNIVTKRLMLYLENNNILSDAQHGFRKNKSTITALNVFKNYISHYINNKRIVCMITIDIQNAFGSIYKQDLLRLMV